MEGPYIAQLASLVGDPGRANMLVALMGGQALTATELSVAAGVTPQTASGHLVKLVDGRLLTVVRQGRHRYYRLASPEVAGMLEVLMKTAIDTVPRHRPRSVADAALAEARTCYNHLAGRVAVGIADALSGRGLIVLEAEGGLVTDDGCAFFAELGIAVPFRKQGRVFCRPCLDWSERRWHLGGVLGGSILQRLKDLDWVRAQPATRRVIFTEDGRRSLAHTFGGDLLRAA